MMEDELEGSGTVIFYEQGSLGDLLSKLTIPGRAQAVLKFTKYCFESKKIPIEHICEAVRYFESLGDIDSYKNAAIISEKYDGFERAAQNYLKAGDQQKAMKVAAEAIKKYERESKFYEAAVFLPIPWEC